MHREPGLSAPTLPVTCGSSCDGAPAASDTIPIAQTSHLPQNQRLWSSGDLEDRRPLPEQGQRAVLLPTHSGSQEHCTNTGQDRQRPHQRIFSEPNNTATPPPGTKPHRPPIVWAEKLEFAGQTHSAVFEKSVVENGSVHTERPVVGVLSVCPGQRCYSNCN